MIIEGLFAHFFSPERQSHHRGDIQWFLELANEQKEWGAFPFEEGAGVVSGSLNEDLFNKMEESILDPKTNVSELHCIVPDCVLFKGTLTVFQF